MKEPYKMKYPIITEVGNNNKFVIDPSTMDAEELKKHDEDIQLAIQYCDELIKLTPNLFKKKENE